MKIIAFAAFYLLLLAFMAPASAQDKMGPEEVGKKILEGGLSFGKDIDKVVGQSILNMPKAVQERFAAGQRLKYSRFGMDLLYYHVAVSGRWQYRVLYDYKSRQCKLYVDDDKAFRRSQKCIARMMACAEGKARAKNPGKKVNVFMHPDLAQQCYSELEVCQIEQQFDKTGQSLEKEHCEKLYGRDL